MNTNMTRATENSKIGNFIVFMTFINMMNVKFSLFFITYVAFIRVIIKSTFSVISRPLSVVFIVFSRTFKRVKHLLFAFVRAKFRGKFSRSSSSIFIFTPNAAEQYFSARFFKRTSPAISTAKVDSSRFVLVNITRTFAKRFFTKLAFKCNKFIARIFVTISGTVFSSPSINRFTADWTFLHKPSLTLAVDKVNINPLGGA